MSRTDELAVAGLEARDVALARRTRVAALLEARAADPRVAGNAERSFFVRYDAWTLPEVRAALGDPDFQRSLSKTARASFVDGMPALDAPTGLFELGAHVLGRAVLDRVELARAGVELPAGAELLDHEREILATWGLDLDRAWWLLAEYQERIFDAAFASSGAGPSPALERAFASFASGALAFVPAPPRDDVPRPTERGIDDALNCEPDGWLFFAFAEFAWNAARVRRERGPYWFALAQLFAALQEVHARTYGPAFGPRSPGSYGRWRRRACDPIAASEIEALVVLYRKQYADRAALEKRLATNALGAFGDRR